MQSDGLILTTCKAYENSGSLDALTAYRAESNEPTFALGPLIPVHYASGNFKTNSNGDTEDALQAFLEDNLEKFGEGSVLFVSAATVLLSFVSASYFVILHYKMSFGTMNWPESLDNVEEVIDCLIERKMPFVSPSQPPQYTLYLFFLLKT